MELCVNMAGGKCRFYAPFDGMMRATNVTRNSITIQWSIENVPIDRWGREAYDNSNTYVAEIHVGDMISPPADQTGGGYIYLVPFINNSEIDRSSAILFDYNLTPGQLHTRIMEASDGGISPFYTPPNIDVSQLGVYGSNKSSKPSTDNILLSPDWTLITEENESNAFLHYALYCPLSSNTDYCCWFSMTDPKTGKVKTGKHISYVASNPPFGKSNLNGCELISVTGDSYVGYRSANLLKFKICCIKLVQ